MLLPYESTNKHLYAWRFSMDKASASEIRLNQWKQIVLEASSASVSKRAWCRDNGISEKQLYYWQRKIRRHEASKPMAPSSGQASTVTAVSGSFVELSFPDPEGQGILPYHGGSDTGPSIRIDAGSWRIHVMDGVREDTLRTVMAVIRDA